jgi:hypothetical protein
MEIQRVAPTERPAVAAGAPGSRRGDAISVPEQKRVETAENTGTIWLK